MYYPTLDEVKSLAHHGNLVPIYRELNADLETPVSAFLKVARPPYAFLLESVEGGERLARYSFLGTEPRRVIRTGPNQPDGARDPLQVIQAELSRYRLVPVAGLPRFHGGAVGYLAYEVVRYFEPRVPPPKADVLGLPEAVFMLCDTLLVFDHLRHTIKVVSHAYLDGSVERAYAHAVMRIERVVRRLGRPLSLPRRPTSPWAPTRRESIVSPAGGLDYGSSARGEGPRWTSNIPKPQYLDMVRKAQEYIRAGDIIQVVLSQRFSCPTTARPLDLYRALRAINPSPYMFFLALDGFYLIGASPELLVRVEGDEVATHPIAGTRPRGRTPEEDQALEEELKSSEKERAEHLMLLDLGRNDIGRVSRPGTVRVTQMMEVERYSHVMHLVSHVMGRLRPDLTCYDALRACFPAGTVSGAPKVRAMEIIAELEPDARGPYAGAVGYFSFSGNMDTCITLRTILLKDGVAHVQAGGGIVYDSTPEGEYEECHHKARALLRAIQEAEVGR
ncbi:MAG: anthranilate synthase component I [Dehalococcoidia bacterium]|nr:anthranilate synthase component I [Dehalococcoidia bacterium]MDW8119108.1 anthranilate synthase component I [Chloroflexota bacterium]